MSRYLCPRKRASSISVFQSKDWRKRNVSEPSISQQATTAAATSQPRCKTVVTDENGSSCPQSEQNRYNELVQQHRDELQAKNLWPPAAGHAQAIENYKTHEVKFRLALTTHDTDRQRDGLDYNSLQRLNITTLLQITRRVVESGSVIPAELIFHLEEAIKGRLDVHNTYFVMNSASGDEPAVGHLHHIKELEWILFQLQNPPVRKTHDLVMNFKNWRRNSL